MNKIDFKIFMAIFVVIAGVFVAFVGCSKKTDNTEATGTIIDIQRPRLLACNMG